MNKKQKEQIIDEINEIVNQYVELYQNLLISISDLDKFINLLTSAEIQKASQQTKSIYSDYVPLLMFIVDFKKDIYFDWKQNHVNSIKLKSNILIRNIESYYESQHNDHNFLDTIRLGEIYNIIKRNERIVTSRIIHYIYRLVIDEDSLDAILTLWYEAVEENHDLLSELHDFLLVCLDIKELVGTGQWHKSQHPIAIYINKVPMLLDKLKKLKDNIQNIL
jgi:hypothetical protein